MSPRRPAAVENSGVHRFCTLKELPTVDYGIVDVSKAQEARHESAKDALRFGNGNS